MTTVTQNLFNALERIMRAVENGHPVGHDAVILGRRALKRAAKSNSVSHWAILTCSCSVCRIEKQETREAAAAMARDRRLGAED